MTLTTGVIAKQRSNSNKLSSSPRFQTSRRDRLSIKNSFARKGIQILSQQQYHQKKQLSFCFDPEQLAQLQEFLAAFQPTTEIVAEKQSKPHLKNQADFLTIVKTGLISTRYLAYLALVLQLEEQFHSYNVSLISRRYGFGRS